MKNPKTTPKTKNLNNEEYLGFVNMVEESIERDKNKVVNEIIQRGDDLIKEISQKRKLKNRQKRNMISYILETDHPDNLNRIIPENTTFDESVEVLFSAYTHEEIEDIYNTLKRKNRSFLKKIKDLLTLK